MIFLTWFLKSNIDYIYSQGFPPPPHPDKENSSCAYALPYPVDCGIFLLNPGICLPGYTTTISFLVASIKTYNRNMFSALPSSGI